MVAEEDDAVVVATALVTMLPLLAIKQEPLDAILVAILVAIMDDDEAVLLVVTASDDVDDDTEAEATRGTAANCFRNLPRDIPEVGGSSPFSSAEALLACNRQTLQRVGSNLDRA